MAWCKEQRCPTEFGSKYCLLVDLQERTEHFNYLSNSTYQKNKQTKQLKTYGHLHNVAKIRELPLSTSSHPGSAADWYLGQSLCFLSLGFSLEVGMVQVSSHRTDSWFYDTCVLIEEASVYLAQPRPR